MADCVCPGCEDTHKLSAWCCCVWQKAKASLSLCPQDYSTCKALRIIAATGKLLEYSLLRLTQWLFTSSQNTQILALHTGKPSCPALTSHTCRFTSRI